MSAQQRRQGHAARFHRLPGGDVVYRPKGAASAPNPPPPEIAAKLAALRAKLAA